MYRNFCPPCTRHDTQRYLPFTRPWHEELIKPQTLQLLWDLYETAAPPLSHWCLRCLARLATIAPASFAPGVEYPDFLASLPLSLPFWRHSCGCVCASVCTCRGGGTVWFPCRASLCMAHPSVMSDKLGSCKAEANNTHSLHFLCGSSQSPQIIWPPILHRFLTNDDASTGWTRITEDKIFGKKNLQILP